MTSYIDSAWGTLSEVLSNAPNLSASTGGVKIKECAVYNELMKNGHLQAMQSAFKRKDGSDRIIRLVGNGGSGMVFEERLPDGNISPEIIRIGPDLFRENVIIQGKRTVLRPSWHAVVNIGDVDYLITSSPKLLEGRVTPEVFAALQAAANAEGVNFIDPGDAKYNYNGNIMFLEDGTPMIVDGARDLVQYSEDPDLSPRQRVKAKSDLDTIQKHGKNRLQQMQESGANLPSWEDGNGVHKQDLLNRGLSEPVAHQTIRLSSGDIWATTIDTSRTNAERAF